MSRGAVTITRDTPPELWPATMRPVEVGAVLLLSEDAVRTAVRSGAIPKIPLPTDNVLIAKGTVLRLVGLSEGIGDAMELARREAAVEVARERLARIAGDLRAAEDVLRLAEERLRELKSGSA
jgi:hypothetical protein